MCSWEGLLDSENEAYVAFYLLYGQGSALLLIVVFFLNLFYLFMAVFGSSFLCEGFL